MKKINLSIHPLKTAIIVMGIGAFFSLFSTAIWYFPRRFQFDADLLYRYFDIDTEMNFPTYYAVLILLFCTVLLGIIAIIKMNDKDRFRIHWMVLAVGFFIMSCDEFMSLHNRLTKPVSQLLKNYQISDYFHFSWVIPAMLFLAVLAIFYLKFFLHLPRKTLLIFLLAAAAYVGGSVGVEMIGGHVKETFGYSTKEYIISTVTEESLEMAGVSIFIYGLLLYIKDHIGQIAVQIGAGKTKS